MSKPWTAEHEVDALLARRLIETQFPQLAPARVELFGTGWDNTAFLVNEQLVFRFPRRQVAVALLKTEIQLLPHIAPRLPLPIPIPELNGQPSGAFPWPFAGYKLIPGRTASAACLDESQRLAAVEPLAQFLRALHSLPADEMVALGAGPDVWGRLEVTRRAARTRERLEALVQAGLVESSSEVFGLLHAAREPLPGAREVLVHGDFYATHLLVNATGEPCGVIDWGDAHLGHRGLDLALVFGFFPSHARPLFEEIYGPLDDDTRQLARSKALEIAVTLITYGHDSGKKDLVREGQVGLRYASDLENS